VDLIDQAGKSITTLTSGRTFCSAQWVPDIQSLILDKALTYDASLRYVERTLAETMKSAWEVGFFFPLDIPSQSLLLSRTA